MFPSRFRSSPVSGAGELCGVSCASTSDCFATGMGNTTTIGSLVLSRVAKATFKTALEASAAEGSCTLSAEKLPLGTYSLVVAYGGGTSFHSSALAKETLTVAK
ncbi:MAG: hypothetical protein WAV54_15355 [Acidimicrobiales bacterium]